MHRPRRLAIPNQGKDVLFSLSCKAFHRCVVLNETMAERTLDIAQNAINVLNTTTNEKLNILGIKDRIVVIMWVRRVI